VALPGAKDSTAKVALQVLHFFFAAGPASCAKRTRSVKGGWSHHSNNII